MNKKLKLLYTLLSSFILLSLFTGCNFEIKDTDTTFNIFSFPYKSKGYEIKVLTYSGNNFMEGFSLGTVSDDLSPVTKTVKIKNEVDRLYVALVHWQEIRYYVYITKMNTEYDVNGYWIRNEDTPEKLGEMFCGISEDYFKSINLDQEYKLDFETAPLVLYHLANVKDRILVLEVSDSSNAALFISEDQERFLNEEMDYCNYLPKNSDADKYVVTPHEDDLYLCACPKNYKEYFAGQDTFISFSLTDMTTAAENWCYIEKSFITSNGKIFLSRDMKEDRWNKTGTNILYSYDSESSKLEKLYEFYDPIEDIQGNDDYLYIASGKALYKYDIKTKTTTSLDTFSNQILAFNIAGDRGYFLISQNSSTWNWFVIYDMSEKKQLAEEKIFYDGDKLIHIPEQNTMYFLNEGVSPQDINYIKWDDSLKITNDDSPYHGDYSFRDLIERFGNQSKLITGDGDIFNVEDYSFTHEANIFESKSHELKDVIFDAEYFYAVVSSGSTSYNESNKKIWIEKRAISNPKVVLAKTEEMKGIRANNLSFVDGKLLLLANSETAIKEPYYQIYCYTFDKNLTRCN